MRSLDKRISYTKRFNYLSNLRIYDDDDVPYPSPKPTGLMFLPVPAKVSKLILETAHIHRRERKKERKKQCIQRY